MKLLVSFSIAATIRFFVMISKYSKWIQDRVEVSTPLNSWKRVQEGVHLFTTDVNPYHGDLYHESPIVLFGTSYLLKNCDHFIIYIFILLDLLTGILLYFASKVFIREMYQRQQSIIDTYAKKTEDLHIQSDDEHSLPFYIALTYLFNPFTIMNCVGQTTTVWSNFLLALMLFALSKRLKFLTCLSLALEVQMNIYPFVLIIPIAIYLAKFNEKNKFLDIFVTISTFLGAFIGLNYTGFVIVGDWSFIDSTYGFIINYRDLQPNIGLFWYFFTEMFDHFRTLFLYTFQMNATILYLLPLTMKLRNEPIMLATMFISIAAIFRSYPCVGDVGFYLALMPMWKCVSKFMAHNFIVGTTMLVTTILAPTVWHLWIYSNSANANFYFGVTLIFATAQIFLITDLFFAFIKREFCLKHGLDIKIDGKDAKMGLEH
uniref:Putative major facilitator superfamily permease n=1 Tax=Corethrella appendiculata TaxID=1370023 RepID=U5EXN7_9DIPT